MSSITIILTLLLLNGALGAIDTLWYHEWKTGLAMRGGALRCELALHAGRDGIYVVIYSTLGWFAWSGPAAWILAALLLVEIVITLTDFVIEDRLRPSIGGMAAGERLLHSAMAIVYGAMLAHLLPLIATWTNGDGGLSRHTSTGPTPPTWMAALATVLGVGIAVSGVRDALAVAGFSPDVFGRDATRWAETSEPAAPQPAVLQTAAPQTESTARAVSPSSSSPLRPVSPAWAARRPKLTT